MKKKYLLGLIGIACIGALASCGNEKAPEDTTPPTNETTNNNDSSNNSTNTNDNNSSTDNSNTNDNNSSADNTNTGDSTNQSTVTIERVYADGEAENSTSFTYDSTTKVLNIAVAGEYNVTGEIKQIICATELEDSVTINLVNATINSGDEKAIVWNSESSKIIVKAKKDTTNTITSGNESAIWSNNNIEIGGKGTLTITSGKNAISGSNIDITGDLTLTATATKNAINGKQVKISAGDLTLTGTNAGIAAEKTSKGKKGTLEISGGTIKINNSGKAIYAESSVSISGDAEIVLEISNSTTAIDCASVTSTATNLTYKLDGTTTTL